MVDDTILLFFILGFLFAEFGRVITPHVYRFLGYTEEDIFPHRFYKREWMIDKYYSTFY